MQHPKVENVEVEPRTVAPLRTDALDYDLPADRIATHPVEPRDAARMLVLWRSDPGHIEHRHVRDLPDYLLPGDALVLNNTAVVPARLIMRRATGGRVEGLFLEEIAGRSGQLQWRVLLRSGGRLAVAERLALLDHQDQPSALSLEVLKPEERHWLVAVHGTVATLPALGVVGRTPLPPYILKARTEHHAQFPDEDDHRWYQTVYADSRQQQSVAAPTAGLHFTPQLLARIDTIGAQRIEVTLHVGAGTFQPVTAETLDQHRMHCEWYDVGSAALAMLKRTRGVGRRVLAVGTTSVRTLESLPAEVLSDPPTGLSQNYDGCRGMTDLLIAPPHRFRHADGMLTNFHLPRSTLLALVAAMVGLERLKVVYRVAIDRGYRFYSYGDAMLILP